MHLSYLEPVSCFSSVWWLPDHRNCSPSWLPWRAGVADDYVSWLSRKYSTSQPPQVALVIKNPPPNAGDIRHRFEPWFRNTPWKRAWQPTPVFLPGEIHRQRSLVGYSPQCLRVRQDWSNLACIHFSVLMNNPKLKLKRIPLQQG